MSEEGAPARGAGAGPLRAILIAIAALGVAVAVAVVVFAGGGSDDDKRKPAAARSVAPPPARCVEAWNGDAVQTGLGGHEARDHKVSRAWVLVLGFDGKVPADPAQGECAVVFPTPSFGDGADDPRHVVQIRNGDAGWQPLRELPAVTPARVEALRAEAVKQANAELGQDGRLTPPSP